MSCIFQRRRLFAVKTVQTRKGSRRPYAQREEAGAWRTRMTPDLADFIAMQTSVFLATASAEGQPYIQDRGGPALLHRRGDQAAA